MKYSENYNLNLPSREDNDPADINLISENFEAVDEILKNVESGALFPEKTITLETKVEDIPKGITKCLVSENAKRGLLIAFNISGIFTETKEIFIDFYANIQERKGIFLDGQYTWTDWDSYVTLSQINELIDGKLSAIQNGS